MSKRTVSNIGHSKFLARFNQTVCLVDRLERGILRLDGINLGDYGSGQWTNIECFRLRNLLELALRSVLAEHSERPMYLVFPALRISSSAGMDSSRGVSTQVSIGPAIRISQHTWVDSMQIVEIGSKAQSVDGALDVLLDVGGRIGDRTVSKRIKTTL